jgi:hypothetical protein
VAWLGEARHDSATQDKEIFMQFEMSNDTKILVNVLGEAKVGDTVTYEAMSAAIGRDVRTYAYPAMRSAREHLLKNKQMVFGVETRVGLVRLNDEQIVEHSESDRKKMLRVSKRALRKLSVVQFDGLSDDKKRQHVVASAQFGALAMFSGKTAAKKIASSVNGDSKQLAIGQTLKLFS